MSEAEIIAIAFLGSFDASFDRRWAYSRAVMPGVTLTRASASGTTYGEIRVINLRSPALSKCGCVSWSGCPKSRSQAAVEAHLVWEVGALVLCLNEESSGLVKGLPKILDLDTRFKTGRLYFILGIYTAGALHQIFLICPC